MTELKLTSKTIVLRIDTLIEVSMQSIYIVKLALARINLKAADMAIEPQVVTIGTFRSARMVSKSVIFMR